MSLRSFNIPVEVRGTGVVTVLAESPLQALNAAKALTPVLLTEKLRNQQTVDVRISDETDEAVVIKLNIHKLTNEERQRSE
jgi:hypothetical protein